MLLSGLALEALAGVVSLASSDLDQSLVMSKFFLIFVMREALNVL